MKRALHLLRLIVLGFHVVTAKDPRRRLEASLSWEDRSEGPGSPRWLEFIGQVTKGERVTRREKPGDLQRSLSSVQQSTDEHVHGRKPKILENSATVHLGWAIVPIFTSQAGKLMMHRALSWNTQGDLASRVGDNSPAPEVPNKW